MEQKLVLMPDDLLNEWQKNPEQGQEHVSSSNNVELLQQFKLPLDPHDCWSAWTFEGALEASG